jgi:hypothetical protein
MSSTTVRGVNGTTIRTCSGAYFDLLNPTPESVHLIDIARGLSHICRFGGQIKQHYSVAQHSLLCADLALRWGATDEQAFAVLMHDAAEAYIGDIVKPLKCLLPAYAEIEAKVEASIGQRFGIDFQKHAALIKEVDFAMLIHERKELFGSDGVHWTGEESARPVSDLPIKSFDAERVRAGFHDLAIFMMFHLGGQL